MKTKKKLLIGIIAILAIFVSNLQYAIDNYGIGNWGFGLDIVASGSGSTGTDSGRDTHMSGCGQVERWDTHTCQYVNVQKYSGSCTTGAKPDCRYFSCTEDPDALTSSANASNYGDLPYDPMNPGNPNHPYQTYDEYMAVDGGSTNPPTVQGYENQTNPDIYNPYYFRGYPWN